jgi:hypothetical protein
MGKAIEKALDRAVEGAGEFKRDNPVWFTIIALGVLVIMIPWVVEALGFCAGFRGLGPVEG